MKVALAFLTMICSVVGGCSDESSGKVVTQGVIYAVQYETGNGQTTGLTRVNSSKAVPGGSGSWNVNAYGALTADFLTIKFPDSAGLSCEVIPVHRLISVSFGDGGIKQVAKQPKVD